MDMADPKQNEKPQRYEPGQQPGGGRSDESQRERENPPRPDPHRRAPDPDEQRHTPRENERFPQRQQRQ
jgi:hypothetical protein